MNNNENDNAKELCKRLVKLWEEKAIIESKISTIQAEILVIVKSGMLE